MTSNESEIIAKLIIKGFTSGYYPDWKLQFSNIAIDDVSQPSLNHIASQISNGFICGHVIEDNKNPDNNGWWEIL
jgi:hypothetical protein